MVQHANIHEAKVAVMGAVEYVQKTGTMKEGAKYKYVPVDEVIAKLRPAMVEHGIHFSPTQMQIMHQENYTTKHGTAMTRVILGVAYRLSHVTGSFEDGFAVGEGTDSGDKACNKAMTAAKKYALLQSFCLETGEDDPDHDPSAEQERKPTAANKTPAKANGSENGKHSDKFAVAREEYKAKIHGLNATPLLAALKKFEEDRPSALAKFGDEDEVDILQAATVTRLYQMMDLDIGGLPTMEKVNSFSEFLQDKAAKYLSPMQVDTLNAKIERRIEAIKEDLEKARRQTA